MMIPGFGPGFGQMVSGGGGWEITSQTTSTTTNNSPFYVSPAAKPGDFAIFMDAAISVPDETQVPFGWDTIIIDRPTNTSIAVTSKVLDAGDFETDLSVFVSGFRLRSLTTLALPSGVSPEPASEVVITDIKPTGTTLSVDGEVFSGFKIFVGYINAANLSLTPSNSKGWHLNTPNFCPTAIKYYSDEVQTESMQLNDLSANSNIGAFVGFNIELTES